MLTDFSFSLLPRRKWRVLVWVAAARWMQQQCGGGGGGGGGRRRRCGFTVGPQQQNIVQLIVAVALSELLALPLPSVSLLNVVHLQFQWRSQCSQTPLLHFLSLGGDVVVTVCVAVRRTLMARRARRRSSSPAAAPVATGSCRPWSVIRGRRATPAALRLGAKREERYSHLGIKCIIIIISVHHENLLKTLIT